MMAIFFFILGILFGVCVHLLPDLISFLRVKLNAEN